MQAPEVSGYTLHDCQGTGTFGSVFRADWDGRLQCAVKLLNPVGIHPAYLSWCLEKLREEERHPNILPVLGFDLAHQPAYVSSAWVDKSDTGPRTLQDAVGRWDMVQNVHSLMALAKALAWLHKRGIIHTGLTSSNVLLLSEDPENIMVTDIGQGLIEASQRANWRRHAPYFSPERCRHEAPHGESSGEAWDVYAFGVIGFRLLTGKFPRAAAFFADASTKEEIKSSSKLDLTALAEALESEPMLQWPEPATNPRAAAMQQAIERCLALQPEARFAHMTDVLNEFEKIEQFPAESPPIAIAPQTPQQTPGELPTLPEPAPGTTASEAPTISKSAEAPAPTPRRPKPASQPRSVPTKVTWLTSAAAVAAAIVALLHFRQAQDLRQDLIDLQSANSKAQQLAAASEAASTKQSQAAQTALNEQNRLKRNLLQEQELSDQLLQTLLDQRPAENDPLAETWRNRLGEYAAHAQDRLKNIASNPDLLESAARTRWNMASINLALGEKKVAEGWLEEALRDVDAAAAATTDKTLHATWDLLAGRILSRRGEINLDQLKYAEAAQQLNQANKSLTAYLGSHADDVTGQREHARAAWLEGRALLAKPDPTAAAQILLKAAEMANGLTFSPAQRDEDIFLLVDTYHELARCQIEMKDDNAALKSFLEPLQKLRTYDRDHPKAPESRERLATSYIEMGRVLSRVGNASEASQALNQGIRLLLELIIEYPENEQYTFLTGTAYGEVSRLISSSGKPADAISYAQSAVQYLNILTEKNRIEPQYRLHYAAELTSLSEIQESISHFPEAVKSGLSAVSLLDELSTEGGLANADRSVAQNCLARIQSSLGRSCENLKQKDEAVSWYSKAIASWQKVAAEGNKDEKVQKNLSWTQDQLKRLQP